MIEMPHRSITRFFIPMIDVLTLLFCIFLLMPMATESAESEKRAREAAGDDKGPKVAPKTDAERAEELKQSLSVRVLEIDGSDGRLCFRDVKGQLREIRNQREAAELITEDRRRAGRRDVYYLVLYPRDPNSGHPTVGERRNYDSWLAGVALGYDTPNSEAGKQP